MRAQEDEIKEKAEEDLKNNKKKQVLDITKPLKQFNFVLDENVEIESSQTVPVLES